MRIIVKWNPLMEKPLIVIFSGWNFFLQTLVIGGWDENYSHEENRTHASIKPSTSGEQFMMIIFQNNEFSIYKKLSSPLE